MRKTRVLIVDDSSTMRKLIRAVLTADPRIEIVAEAADAVEARHAVNSARPDVMTLDVEMPKMSGLEFLERLMRNRPMPVVMVSTLTHRGSRAAIEALSLGAVECVEKPKFGLADKHFHNLADTVVVAATARVRHHHDTPPQPAIQHPARKFGQKIILIGGSTGAVEAIETILKGFPPNCPPTLITQHMPAPFLQSFAARLHPRVAPTVRLADHGDQLVPGQVLIAPGGDFHLEVRQENGYVARLVNGPTISGHRPSVDALFNSATSFAPQVVATILTGMGRDGAEGMYKLRENGAVTIGQSQDSCVVFGMPRVAGEMGGVEEWCDLEQISEKILGHCVKNAKVNQ